MLTYVLVVVVFIGSNIIFGQLVKVIKKKFNKKVVNNDNR